MRARSKLPGEISQASSAEAFWFIWARASDVQGLDSTDALLQLVRQELALEVSGAKGKTPAASGVGFFVTIITHPDAKGQHCSQVWPKQCHAHAAWYRDFVALVGLLLGLIGHRDLDYLLG